MGCEGNTGSDYLDRTRVTQGIRQREAASSSGQNGAKRGEGETRAPAASAHALDHLVLNVWAGTRTTRKAFKIKNAFQRGFPGGSVVKNPPDNAGDTGLIPDPGRPREAQEGPRCLGAIKPEFCNKRSHHSEKPVHN